MTDSVRILCIDDNLRNLRILQELLEDDFVLSCASSGEEGLRAVAATSPALILLDLMMPDLDGYEICRRLKDAPETRDIPIVLLSALQREEDVRQGLEAGANAYLAKPFDPDELLDLVEAHVAPARLPLVG